MPHGLYGGTFTPWVMDRTVAQVTWVSHGSWVVQQYTYPMGHVLCNSMHTPWVMDHTVVELG